MNLCIDIGNTRAKAAIFTPDENLLDIKYYPEEITAEDVAKIKEEYPIKQAILASVANHSEALTTALQSLPFYIPLSHTTPLPVQLNYDTPTTLGRDRIAVVVAGNALFANSDLLVIDAGTCITYDFIDKKAVYHGGSISPGFHMKFKALHSFTDQLPLIETNETEGITGKTTRASIISGVIYGTIAEIGGIISFYRAKYPGLKVLMTGGDSAYFDSMLKSRIFVLPNLLLQGLNQILIYNGSQH